MHVSLLVIELVLTPTISREIDVLELPLNVNKQQTAFTPSQNTLQSQGN